MRDEQTRASVFLPPSWLDEEGRLCYSAHVLESIPEESEPPSSRTSRYGSFHRDTEAPRRPGRGDSLFSPETGEGDVSLFADSDSHESAASPLEEGRGDGPAPGAPLHLESKRADAGVLPPGEVFSPDVACARHVDGDRGKRAGDGPQRQEQLDHKGPDAGAGEGYGLVFRESGRAPSLEGAAPLHTEPSEDPRKQRETGSFAEGEAGSEVGDTRELSICSPPEQPEVPPPRQASSGQDAPCCGEKASCFVRQNSPLQSYGEAPNGEVSFPHTSHGSLHVPAPHDASNAARVRASSVQEQSALSRPFTQAEPRRPLSAPPPRPSSLDSRGAALVSPEREERTFSPESTGSPLCAAARYADARTDKPRAVRMPSALGDDERDGTGKPGAKREKEKWRAEEIAEEAPFENAIDEKRNGRHRVGLSGSSSGNHGTLPSSALPFPLWAALRFGSLSFFLDFRDVIALSAASFPLRLLLCGSQPCASPHALLAFGEGEGGDTAEEKKGRVFQSLFSSDAPGARDASPQVARQGADTRESEKGRRTPAPGQRRHGQAERRRGKERGALRKDTLEVEEEMKSEWSRFNALAQRRKTDTSGEKTERRARECAALPAGVFSHIRVTTAWAALDEEFVRELFRRATRLSVLEISIRRDCLSALLQRGSPVPARTSPFVPAASSGCSHSPCCRQSCSGPSAAVQRRLMLCLERAVSAFVLNCETLESFALHVEGEDAGSPFFFSPTSRVNWASPTPSPRSRFHPASASPSSVSSSFSRFGCSSLGFEPRLGELWEAPTAQSVDHLFPRLRRFSSRGTFGLLILLSSCLHAWIQSEGFSSRPTPGQELRGAGEQQRGTEGRKGRDREGGGDARVSFSGLFRSWAFAKDRKRCREKGVGVQQRTADRAPAAEANEHFKRSAPTLTHLEISDRSSWFDLSLLLPFLSSLAQPACEGDERRPLSAAASASVSSLASAETGERREARLAGLELALAFLREQTAKFLHFLGSLIRASHASLHALTLDFAPPLLFQRLRSCSPSAEPASSPPASPAQSRKTHAQGDTAAVGNVFPSFENCGPLSGLLLLSDRLFSSLVRSDLPPLFGSDQARVLSSGQGRSRKDEKGRETDLVQPRGEREETEGQKGQTPRRHSNDREFHGSEEPFPDGSECEERERDASYFGAYLFLLSLILPSFSAVSPPSTSFSFPYLVCLSLSDAIATGKALRRSCALSQNSLAASPASPSSVLPSATPSLPHCLLSFHQCDEALGRGQAATKEAIERGSEEWQKKFPVLEEVAFSSPFCLFDLENSERVFQNSQTPINRERHSTAPSSDTRSSLQTSSSSPSSSSPSSCRPCSSFFSLEFLCGVLKRWMGGAKSPDQHTRHGATRRKRRVSCFSLLLLDSFTDLSSCAVQQFLQLVAPSLCHLILRFPPSRPVPLLVPREDICLPSSPLSPSSVSPSSPSSPSSSSFSRWSSACLASRQHDLGQGEHTVCAERRGEKRGCGASPGSSTAAQSGRSGGLAKHAQSSHFAFMRLRSLQIVDFNPLLHLLLSEAAFAWRNEISHVPSRSPSSPSPHTQPPAPSSLALSLVWEGEGVEEWKGEEEEENETGESDREDDSCVWSSASSSRASASRARGRLPTARQGEKEGEAKNWEYTEGLQEYLDVCDTLRRHRRFGAELIHAFLSKLPRFSLVLPPSGVQAARTLALLFSPSTSSLFSSEVARRRAMGLVLPFFMNPALFPLAEKPGNPCLSASSLRAVEGARDFPAFASSPREPPHEACAVSTVSAVSCALSASRPLPDPAPRLGRKSEEGLSFSVSPPELDRFVGILKLLTATALLEHGFLFPLESPDFFLERERRVRLRGTRDEKDGGKAPREKRRGLWDFLSALSTFPSSSSMPATRGLRKDERASTRDAPCPRTPARSLSSPQPRRQRRSVLWSALWPRDLEEPTPSARKRERRASARHRLGSASPCGDETAGKEGAETREAREETDSQDDSSSWTEREDASPSNCDAPISRWPGAPSLLSSGEHPSCASRSYERGERRKVSGFSEPEQRQSARLPSRLRSNVSTHAVHTASSSATWARRFVVPFCFSSSSSSPFSGGVYGEARNARRGVRTGDRRRLARGLSRDVECMRQFKKQEIGLKPTEASLRFLHQQLNGLGWEGPRRLPDPAAGETRGTQGEKSGDKSGLGQREKGAALGPQSVAGPPVRRKTLLEQRLEKAELLLWREQGEERAKGEDGRTGEGRKGEGITGEGREEEGRSRGKKGCERRTVQSYSVSSDGRIPVFAKGRTNLPRHFRYVDRVVSSLSGVFSDVRRSASSFFRQSEAGEGDQERGQNPTEEREASEIHDGEPRPDAGRFVSKWKSFFVFSGRKDGEERTLRTRETVRPKPGKVPVKKRGRLLNHVHPYSCIETLELLFIPPASRSTAMPSSSGSCLSCSLSSLSCFSCVSCSCCSSSRSSLASDREATRALCRRLFASHSPYRTALIQIFRFTLPRLRLFRLAFASHRPHPSSVPVFLPQKVRAGDPTFSNRSRLFVSCSSSRSPPCLCGEEESRRLMRAERDRTDESRFRSLFRALGFDDETGGKSRDEACLELPATLREFEPVSPCLRDAPDGAFGSACLFLLDVRPGGRDGRISPRAPAPLLFSVTSLACFARMSSSALCRAASLEEAPPSPSSVPESASTLPTSSPRLLSASSESSWSSPRSAHSSPRLLRLSSSASFHRLGRLPASVSLAYLAVAPDLISSAIARSSLLPRLLFPLLRRASSLFAACQQIERNYAHFLPAPVQLPEAPTRMAGEVRTAVLAAVDVVLEEIELLPPREEEARRRGEAASEEGDRSGETHRAKTVERTGR
uniref:ATPase, AAA family domain-containing protein,putative n=1 Tax=Neospora caninum (strain Liverpool) TaxID=572307 RepID=A0A0F7UM05_NEOCL|nr:TPA: ATPase, AAA family domain-containing protein,putative [Neospora caninum Liverpool]